MKKLVSFGLAMLLAGCATPTVTPKKPLPPLPPGFKPVKAAAAPRLAVSPPRSVIYTPEMTNVLAIRHSSTNSVVLSYPTNAWNWALQYTDTLTGNWAVARLTLTNDNWRTTNGQWFEVTRPSTNSARFYRLVRPTYGVRLIWDVHPQSNILAGFVVYKGTASRTYDGGTFISALDAFNERRAGAGNGFPLTNLNVSTDYYFAVTAKDNDGLESDFSAEVFLRKVTD